MLKGARGATLKFQSSCIVRCALATQRVSARKKVTRTTKTTKKNSWNDGRRGFENDYAATVRSPVNKAVWAR